MAGSSPFRRLPKKRVRRNVGSRNPAPDMVMYRGSLAPMRNDTTTVTLYDNATVTTDAAGLISSAYNNNPGACRNWTEYSTSWGEYRVLGIKFSYDPIAVVNTAAIPGFSGYHSIVHGTPTTPASLAQAASTGISKRWNAFRPFVREWRMADTGEAQFIDTSAPAQNSFVLTLYASGGGNAIYYGNILLEYLVQFRTHNL
jgi:hypothetical protein